MSSPRVPTLRCVVVSILLTATGGAEAQHETVKLTASDGEARDHFGFSVSVCGDTAFIGADYDDDVGANSGSVYVFDKVGGVWTQVAKLTAADGAANDWFGFSVHATSDTAVVGAYLDDDHGPSSGSAYVFERAGSVWTEVSKLTASDGAGNDAFGGSVAVSGETVVAGALRNTDSGTRAGSAYVFERVGGVWTQSAKLTAADGAEDDRFGVSVSVSGSAAVVGAYHDDDNGADSGSAYVFEKIGGVWTQSAKLTAADGTDGDLFGRSVSVSGGTVFVGAHDDDDLGTNSGSVYVFELTGGVWTQVAKLTAADGVADDWFGLPVAVSGDTAVVGASGGDDYGAAYVFKKSGGVWTQSAKLTASDGSADDMFGFSASVSGDTVFVGAYDDDDLGANSGSVYVFDVGACVVDLNDDGLVDTQDFIAFLNAWASGDPLADWDGNGIIDTRDFIAYLNAWVAGC